MQTYPNRQYDRDYKGCNYYTNHDQVDRKFEVPRNARKNKDKNWGVLDFETHGNIKNCIN